MEEADVRNRVGVGKIIQKDVIWQKENLHRNVDRNINSNNDRDDLPRSQIAHTGNNSHVGVIVFLEAERGDGEAA